MNMENLIYDYEKYFCDGNIVYAHVDDNGNCEKLRDHLSLALKYYCKLSEEKSIDMILDNILDRIIIKGNNLNEEYKDIIKQMFVNAVYLHDIGKFNPYFQRIKMANPHFDVNRYKDQGDSGHSLLSSLIYIDCFSEKLCTIKDKTVLTYLQNIIFSFAYSISRHHSNLKDMETFLDKLEELYKRVKRNPKYLYGYEFKEIDGLQFFKNSIFRMKSELHKNLWKYDGIEHYILNKILFSLIVSCDFYATYEFMSGQAIEDFGLINDINELASIYKNTEIYKGIQAYRTNTNYFGNNSINSIRSELFLEVDESLESDIDKRIFYLEAPTGSGKTNISINASLKIVEKDSSINKIFYIFPFNTLVEQTKKNIDDIFKEEKNGNVNTAVINSITPIITKEERADKEECVDWEKHLLDRQLLHYPIVLTTHVNFFNYLFGTGREVNLPLVHLSNSVIIIDEIQSYKNDIWTEIIMFLEKYSSLLNMKIIIMSATLPKLDLLLPEATSAFVELVKDKRRYYDNPFFKNRVQLNYELLDLGEIDESTLVDKVKRVTSQRGESRMLIEFINRGRARCFYNLLTVEMPEKRIVEITGDDNKYYRNKILNEINEKDDMGNEICKDIVVVATQVIEAGVNIDMDIGFKDISMLDNEEQFLGRINRSCKKENCIAFFFHMDDARKIYRKDFRLDKDLRDKEYRKYLADKAFANFYNNTFKRINEKNQRFTRENINNRIYEAAMLQYREVEKNMQLIEDKYYQLYIPYELKDSDGKLLLDGEKIWYSYKDLINDNKMGYAEKKIKLSKLSAKMDNFIFDMKGKPPSYSEEFGSLFYFEEGKSFVNKEGKFDRARYIKEFGGSFL